MGKLFGTDGIRGIANDTLGCELATRVGRAAATLFSDKNRRPAVIIGCDTRASSDMLCSALTAGLCSAGADVMLTGVISTPAVAYLVGKYAADGGIMVSASHNPAEFNGIKLLGPRGLKLSDDEETQVELLMERPRALPTGGGVGRVTAIDGTAHYIDHLRRSGPYDLSGLKIAVDCANGAACTTAPGLFESLGARVHILNAAPDGVNINRECGSTHLLALSEYVTSHGLDCGVAFDGDADRCLAVDEYGREVDGDAILAMCALDMKARGQLSHNTLVATVMSNMGLSRFCRRHGIILRTAPVGDRYVWEEMVRGGYCLGGEQSGHIIFRRFAATGDGQLTALRLLSLLGESGQTLSKAASVMTRFPQVTQNVAVSPRGKTALDSDGQIAAAARQARAQLGDEGRLLIRASGTEPLIRVMVECSDEALMSRVAQNLADVIRERLCGL